MQCIKPSLFSWCPAQNVFSEYVLSKAFESYALNAKRAAAGGLFGVVTLLKLRAPTLGIVQLPRAAGQRNALI